MAKMKCPDCGKKFKSEHGVAVHQRRKHRTHFVKSITGAADTPKHKTKARPKLADMGEHEQPETISQKFRQIATVLSRAAEGISYAQLTLTEISELF